MAWRNIGTCTMSHNSFLYFGKIDLYKIKKSGNVRSEFFSRLDAVCCVNLQGVSPLSEGQRTTGETSGIGQTA